MLNMFPNSLSKRISSGINAQVLSQVINIIIRVAEIPLFLYFLDLESYALWIVLSSVSLYFLYSDGGFISASRREMTRLINTGFHSEAIILFNANLHFIKWIAFGLTVIGVLLSLLVEDSLYSDVITGSNFTTILLLLVGHIVMVLLTLLFYCVFAAAGEYGRGTMFLSLGYAVEFLGLFAALFIEVGLLQAAMGLLLGRIIAVLCMFIAMKKRYFWLDLKMTPPDYRQLRLLLKPALASLSVPVSELLLIVTPRLIVSYFFGAQATVLFTTMRTLSRIAVRPVIAINRIIEPEISIAVASRNLLGYRMLFYRSILAAILITCLISIISFFFGSEVYTFWTQGKLPFDNDLFLLFIVEGAFMGIATVLISFPSALNRHAKFAMAYIGLSLCTILIVFYAAGEYGLTGAALMLAFGSVSVAVAFSCLLIIHFGLVVRELKNNGS